MSATISEVVSALRRAKTIHSETLPPIGPMRDLWKREREAIEALERQMLERLNAQREVRA